MEKEERYSKIVEKFASRNFKIGDRVKAYFKGRTIHGEVAEKYMNKERGFCVLMKTDEKVDDSPNAYLDGFGIEFQVGSPRITFEDEPLGGENIFNKKYLREMTPEEKEEHDSSPF